MNTIIEKQQIEKRRYSSSIKDDRYNDSKISGSDPDQKDRLRYPDND